MSNNRIGTVSHRSGLWPASPFGGQVPQRVLGWGLLLEQQAPRIGDTAVIGPFRAGGIDPPLSGSQRHRFMASSPTTQILKMYL
jgi:hypothetical protein